MNDIGPYHANGVIENAVDPSMLIALSDTLNFESLHLYGSGYLQTSPYVALQPTLFVIPDYTVSFLVKPKAAILLPSANHTPVDVSLGQKFVIVGRNLSATPITEIFIVEDGSGSGSGSGSGVVPETGTSLSVSVGVNGIVLFQSDNNASSSYMVPLAVVPFNLHDFSLVSITVSGVGYIEVYINATLVSTVLAPYTPPNFAPLSFGSNMLGNFEGYLAFVSVFDQILSSSQISPFIPFTLLSREYSILFYSPNTIIIIMI